MIPINFVSALAMAASLLTTASAQSSSVSPISEPTKTMPASAMQTIGCFETGTPLLDYGPGEFASPGKCQQICLGLNKDVLGLSEGRNCWCGDSYPAKSAQVDNGTCSTGCSGTKDVICGGKGKLWVMSTGNTLNEIDYFNPKSVTSSSKTTTTTSATAAPASTQAAESTKVVIATNTPSAEPEKKGPNTAGIAAGVVVGVVVLLAVIGGVWFFLRQRKRREVEEEYRRQAAVNSFVAGGKLHTSNSSMTDSRLDPDFMARRQSNGSIADNEDYSRRILKVTNA